MKKRLLSFLAAAAITLSLSACKPSETAQETQTSQTGESAVTVSETIQAAETTAPENTEVIYETLAEGQERDWKIEDVLKNDLEIDGIPISIPCTVEELLNTLGDGYSVDEREFVYEGDTITSCKYFSGEFVSIMLYFKNEKTYNLLSCISESKDINYKTLNVIGFNSLDNNWGVEINKLKNNSSLKQYISNNELPNQIIYNGDETSFFYIDDDCFLQIVLINQEINRINGGFITEG